MSKHGYKFLLVAVGLLFIGISALVAVGCLSDHPSSLSLSKLESQARQGTIARVVINGTTADVTDSHGRVWQTELPTDSGAVAEKLTMAGVDVTYGQARGVAVRFNVLRRDQASFRPAERRQCVRGPDWAVDQEVTQILNEACHGARQILARHREAMDRAVALLKEVETISVTELDEIVASTNRVALPAS